MDWNMLTNMEHDAIIIELYRRKDVKIQELKKLSAYVLIVKKSSKVKKKEKKNEWMI